MENFLRLRQDHRLKTNLLYILRATLGQNNNRQYSGLRYTKQAQLKKSLLLQRLFNFV